MNGVLWVKDIPYIYLSEELRNSHSYDDDGLLPNSGFTWISIPDHKYREYQNRCSSFSCTHRRELVAPIWYSDVSHLPRDNSPGAIYIAWANGTRRKRKRERWNMKRVGEDIETAAFPTSSKTLSRWFNFPLTNREPGLVLIQFLLPPDGGSDFNWL